MTETSEGSGAPPATAGDQPPAAAATPDDVAANNETNTRGREHQVLEQVLVLLAAPALDISNATNNESAQQLLTQNQELRSALSSMAGLLRDRTGQSLTLERKVGALNVQVSSLKEVVALTKDLLNIRNMEVTHLKQDISNMQSSIDYQKQKYNETIGKLDLAFQLNAKLKEEYQTQLRLFQELREKYAERALVMERNNANKEMADVSNKE